MVYYLSENENQDHADVQAGLLGVGSDTSITDNSNGQSYHYKNEINFNVFPNCKKYETYPAAREDIPTVRPAPRWAYPEYWEYSAGVSSLPLMMTAVMRP